MQERTCSEPECESPVKAVGLCNAHYIRRRKSDPRPIFRHSITDCDPVKKEATCAICGRVPVVVRATGRVECLPHKREVKAKARATGRARARSRADRLRDRYGLTTARLKILEEQAGGRCLICNEEFGDSAYHVDHCHDTGMVRGLLCRNCNLGLGFFGDDPSRLISAHLYLRGSGRVA